MWPFKRAEAPSGAQWDVEGVRPTIVHCRSSQCNVYVSKEASDADIRRTLGECEAVRRNFNDSEPFFIKGAFEGSPTGVYRTLDRLNWGSFPIFLDIVTGEEAVVAQQEHELKAERESKEKAWKVYVMRMRWSEGWRKCAQCGAMYMTTDVEEKKKCAVFEEGFSESSGGAYRNKVVRTHVPVEAMFAEDAKLTDGLTVIGGIFGGWVGGVQDYTYVFQKKGKLGVSGEVTNGWQVDDFVAIDAPKPDLESFNPSARCTVS